MQEIIFIPLEIHQTGYKVENYKLKFLMVWKHS